jgi:hypothetical protein
MLYIGNSTSYLSYSLTNGLSIKGKINATTLDVNDGTIGGWSISGSGLSKTVANKGTIYLGADYAINANKKFRVDYEGNVWINSLKVKVGNDYETIEFSDLFK